MDLNNFVVLILLMCVHKLCAQKEFLSYENARNAIIEAEDQLATGGRIYLSNAEQAVDDIFMRYKIEELQHGFRNPETNAPGMHFFKAKKLIEASKIFRFLKNMPKGALLHVHNTASVSSEFFVHNISYTPGLLRCTNEKGISILSFRRQPKIHGCTSEYVLVSKERFRLGNPQTYDYYFHKLINLYTPTPEEYTSINQVWSKFENMFTTIHDVINYLPVYRDYHWQMLREIYEDNIMYAEVRLNFKELYDRSGRTFPREYTIRELINIVEQFRQKHKNFAGIKVIFSIHRDVQTEDLHKQMDEFTKLHKKFPNFIIGFDLVGQEDKGRPLLNFIDTLTNLPKSAKFFFHAGETNLYGASTDYNLIDAILLNTTRIGHGYALNKHPLLWHTIKQRNIAIEVSPISNQVLHLVQDLRNHPGSLFLSENLPMVICNDDPGFWGARGLSYDFYYTIMSLASNNAGLKVLKNLVWNSIRYSTFTDNERESAYTALERTWTHFIDDVLQGFVF